MARHAKKGFPVHVIELLEHLYKNQEAAVKTSCGTSEWFSIERGVRQGCIVSPSLFNIYPENITREATENTSAGITIGVRKINNLGYADDTTLLCESKEDIIELLTRIQHLSKEKGLPNGEKLEEVKSFVYLGSLINTEVSCMPEVSRRLCVARSTIENMTTILKSQAICKSLKLRIARATAFAVATHGCESWAYSKKVTKKIEAFEMWTAASIMAAAQYQRLDFRAIKNEANASETNEEKEDETFWSHHQTQQP